MADNSFLGMGMKFPPQVNPATGRFEVSAGEVSVRESVYLILMTAQSERPMRPEFGTNLMSYTFLDLNHTMLNMVIRSVKDQLVSQEPRIDDVNIVADTTSRPGAVLFDISYVVRETNVRDNLVFPFYLNMDNEETEEESEDYEPVITEEMEI